MNQPARAMPHEYSTGPRRPGDEQSGASRRAERRSLLRYGAAVGGIAVILVGVAYLFSGHDDMPPPRQVRELTIVNIVPPPPPPPPPQQMPEQKMIEQPKMTEQEFKEERPVEQPKDEPVRDAKNDQPPGPLSLDAKPVGPGDAFGLGGKPGGSPYGGGGGGSRWGWYASMVQNQIESAWRSNRKTRSATLQLMIRLWADGTGHIIRVQIEPSSTGDAELDAAIRTEVLGNLMLREPPPKDMPMPMVTRVTARRPS